MKENNGFFVRTRLAPMAIRKVGATNMAEEIDEHQRAILALELMKEREKKAIKSRKYNSIKIGNTEISGYGELYEENKARLQLR